MKNPFMVEKLFILYTIVKTIMIDNEMYLL